MNSQPRREVFGGREHNCRLLGRLRARCWVARCWAQCHWTALVSLGLAGAVLLIGCGRSGDSTATFAARSPANIEHPTTNIERRTEEQAARALSEEASAAVELPVTPVAFAEAAEGASGVKGATFDDIKFEMKKEETFKQRMLTDKVKDLFDKDIRIRGYILPTYKQSGLTQFVLVRDNQECCFGPGAALFDCIVVNMVEGHTAEFSVRPVTVEGKFSFQKLEIDGKLLAIYHLDAVSVK